jgi:hypothetical protein
MGGSAGYAEPSKVFGPLLDDVGPVCNQRFELGISGWTASTRGSSIVVLKWGILTGLREGQAKAPLNPDLERR